MPDWVVTLFVALSGLVYLFSKIQRERKGLPSTETRVKIPLSWGLTGFALLLIFTLGNIQFFHLQGFPVPGAFWFFVVALTAAILISGIVLIKRKGREFIAPEEKKAGTHIVAMVGVLVVVMPVVGFSIRAVQRKFGF
jgi:hypothetical protein